MFLLFLISFLSINNNVPTSKTTIEIPFNNVNSSPKKIMASIIVKTVEDLSIGTTLFTSPSCNALK